MQRLQTGCARSWRTSDRLNFAHFLNPTDLHLTPYPKSQNIETWLMLVVGVALATCLMIMMLLQATSRSRYLSKFSSRSASPSILTPPCHYMMMQRLSICFKTERRTFGSIEWYIFFNFWWWHNYTIHSDFITRDLQLTLWKIRYILNQVLSTLLP